MATNRRGSGVHRPWDRGFKNSFVGSLETQRRHGGFYQHAGCRGSCDAYVCEIAAKDQTLAERYLFEELIYIVKGRGATTVWQEGGRKQTFEWQEGSMFSPPLNSWRQH